MGIRRGAVVGVMGLHFRACAFRLQSRLSLRLILWGALLRFLLITIRYQPLLPTLWLSWGFLVSETILYWRTCACWWAHLYHWWAEWKYIEFHDGSGYAAIDPSYCASSSNEGRTKTSHDFSLRTLDALPEFSSQLDEEHWRGDTDSWYMLNASWGFIPESLVIDVRQFERTPSRGCKVNHKRIPNPFAIANIHTACDMQLESMSSSLNTRFACCVSLDHSDPYVL